MTAGLVAAEANAELNTWRNTAKAAIANVYMKLHVGDPGAACTANPSAVTTRNVITWNAPSGGSMALNTVGSYSMTTTETITHVSWWDDPTAGNALQSAPLTASVPVINGSALTFTAVTISRTPIAA